MLGAEVLVPAPKLSPPVPSPNDGAVVAPNEVPPVRLVDSAVPVTREV